MKDNFCKIGIIFVATILSISAFFVDSSRQNLHLHVINSCSLQYEREVPNKPNIFVVVSNVPGLCYINSTKTSSVDNFHHQMIPCVDYHPGALPQAYQPRLLVSPNNFMKMETSRGLNYDAFEKSIYYVSSSIGNRSAFKIIKRNFNESTNNVVFDNTHYVSIDKDVNFKRKYEITDLAYDWITKNVYMNARKCILVVNAATSKSPITIIDNRSEIISPVVHPNEGYLYFIDVQLNFNDHKTSVRNAIYRANQDGSNIVQITPTDDKQMSSLAIDFYTDRLYWNVPSLDVIKYSNLDGSDVKSFRSGSLYFGLYNEAFSSIAIDQNYVYYIKKSTNSIQRYKKINDEDDKIFELKTKHETPIVELMIYDPDAQQVREDHPCIDNNGGCQKFCFAMHQNERELKRVCKCSDGEVLAEDRVSCKKI